MFHAFSTRLVHTYTRTDVDVGGGQRSNFGLEGPMPRGLISLVVGLTLDSARAELRDTSFWKVSWQSEGLGV